jgi:hypothetical protein
MESAIRILCQVAMVVMAIALIPFGVGAQLKTRPYVVIGLYLLGVSLLLILIATLLWTIGWVRKNVRIE